MLHCIIHRPNRPFHITDSDFVMTSENAAQTAAKRVLEWKTDALIEDFARIHPLPHGHLPADDYLWIPEWEVSPAQLSFLTVETRCKTTFATTMAELVARGDVAERYVAYRGSYPRPARVSVPLCYDAAGDAFLVVTNYAGEYQDAEEAWHNACKEGYTRIFKQYLYCFEAVNARIARLEGRTPSILKRFSPPKKEAPPSSAQGTIATVSSVPRNDDGGATAKNTTRPAASGGFPNSAGVSSFTGENTTDDNAPSMVPDIRRAPKTPETWLALMSRHLSVPPKPSESDKAGMECYLTRWYEPALFMINDTRDLEPSRAWAESERRIIGALCGPTWQAQKRATQGVQLTARDIVGPAKLSKPLTGATWRTLWNELEKQQWWPDHTTPYDGPPLTYEQGYQAVTPAPAVLEPPIIVEPPEIPTTRPAPMSRQEAVALCDTLVDAHPTLRPALTPKDSTRTAWYASVEIGPGVWHDFTCSRAVNAPETEAILDRALSFAAKPGARTEPPPIILEARQSALPQTEPLPALPADKAAMSLWIAEALLDQIERTGYSVQLRNLSDDRASLSVETSPGSWTDIDSSAEWQQHLKSSTSPPGSIGAVLSVALQREAVQG